MGRAGCADAGGGFALVETALTAVRNIRDGAFWKLLPDEQLEFGRRLEMLSRQANRGRARRAWEVETLGIAKDRSCSSTQEWIGAAHGAARDRVAFEGKAAAQILPRDLM